MAAEKDDDSVGKWHNSEEGHLLSIFGSVILVRAREHKA